MLRSLTSNENNNNTNNNIQLETNGKRKQVSINKTTILSIDENDSANMVTPPTSKQKLSIAKLIGNYFSSNDAKILFNCSENETVYDCLTRRIDCFHDILNRKLDILKVVNKAKTKDGEMNDNQKMLMIKRMQYLMCAYYNLLECDVNQNIKFSDCCKKAIKQLEMVGVRLINNYQVLMRWNRVFR